MEKLPPIPTPASLRWRQFRIQAVPAITFMALVLGVVTLWQHYVIPTSVIGHMETNENSIVRAVPGNLIELRVHQSERAKQGQPHIPGERVDLVLNPRPAPAARP